LVAADKRREAGVLDEIEALSAGLDIGPAPDFVMPGRKDK